MGEAEAEEVEWKKKGRKHTITSSSHVVCADFVCIQEKTCTWPRMISLIFGECAGNVLDDD